MMGRRNLGAGKERPSRARLRLWLRLLRTTRFVEAELRDRLRREFDATLPRFDVLAALHRSPQGMMMSQLSHFLMVSNGNVTGIVDRLVADGLIVRTERKGDRRTTIVKLTAKGRRQFEKMAAVHEDWVDELLGTLDRREVDTLTASLETLKQRWQENA